VLSRVAVTYTHDDRHQVAKRFRSVNGIVLSPLVRWQAELRQPRRAGMVNHLCQLLGRCTTLGPYKNINKSPMGSDVQLA